MKPRPLHPFPFLIHEPYAKPEPRAPKAIALNRFERQLLDELRRGAKLMFDMKQGRALVYSWQAGLKELFEITVRTLARLVRIGRLVAVGRQERLVHYAMADTRAELRAWYDNKDAC